MHLFGIIIDDEASEKLEMAGLEAAKQRQQFIYCGDFEGSSENNYFFRIRKQSPSLKWKEIDLHFYSS